MQLSIEKISIKHREELYRAVYVFLLQVLGKRVIFIVKIVHSEIRTIFKCQLHKKKEHYALHFLGDAYCKKPVDSNAGKSGGWKHRLAGVELSRYTRQHSNTTR